MKKQLLILVLVFSCAATFAQLEKYSIKDIKKNVKEKKKEDYIKNSKASFSSLCKKLIGPKHPIAGGLVKKIMDAINVKWGLGYDKEGVHAKTKDIKILKVLKDYVVDGMKKDPISLEVLGSASLTPVLSTDACSVYYGINKKKKGGTLQACIESSISKNKEYAKTRLDWTVEVLNADIKNCGGVVKIGGKRSIIAPTEYLKNKHNIFEYSKISKTGAIKKGGLDGVIKSSTYFSSKQYGEIMYNMNDIEKLRKKLVDGFLKYMRKTYPMLLQGTAHESTGSSKYANNTGNKDGDGKKVFKLTDFPKDQMSCAGYGYHLMLALEDLGYIRLVGKQVLFKKKGVDIYLTENEFEATLDGPKYQLEKNKIRAQMVTTSEQKFDPRNKCHSNSQAVGNVNLDAPF